MHSYTSRPFDASAFREAGRIDLVFSGVDRAGPSFEGRVFLNNPGADGETEKTAETGYAGSYHVYAYGWPLPPELAEIKERQGSAGGPVAPFDERVHADMDAVRAALERSGELTVTVVPLPVDPGGPLPERPFESVELVADRASSPPL